MTMAPRAGIEVTYEGEGVAPELWAMTQANFAVHFPGKHVREFAVMVNDAAIEYLAAELSRDDTADFRRMAARYVGEEFLPGLVAESVAQDPLVTVSKMTFERSPGLLDRVRARFAA